MQKVTRHLISSLVFVGLVILSFSCNKKNDIAPETVADRDGNVYHTTTIGTQVWMVENLRTTKFNDGTSIPLVTENPEWISMTSPGYCWYNNDAANKNTCGALYNWFTVSTGKLSPTGWHIPSDAEWTTLINYLGGENSAGGKMKSAGTIEDGTGAWHEPNTGATNESGFSANPGGFRNYYDGSFFGLGGSAVFWTSTEDSTDCAWRRGLNYNAGDVARSSVSNKLGFSIRCIRDN
jgi:uncharacterized protein (TIGR02145 family)